MLASMPQLDVQKVHTTFFTSGLLLISNFLHHPYLGLVRIGFTLLIPNQDIKIEFLIKYTYKVIIPLFLLMVCYFWMSYKYEVES
jgi:hypothetical protein